MKYLNGNKKNSLNNLEKFLNARRLKQQNQSKIVKKLLLNITLVSYLFSIIIS